MWGDDNPVRVLKLADLSLASPPPQPIKIEVDVGPDGNILNVRLLQSSGDANLDAMALDAARKTVFAPATLNGLPVHGTIVLEYPPDPHDHMNAVSRIRSRPSSQTKARVVSRAKELGFDLVGIASAQPFIKEERIFKERRDRNYLERWHYDDRTIETHCTPSLSLRDARSIVCTATSYYSDVTPHDPRAAGLEGAISNYAWGQDYHKVIGRRLNELADFITCEFPGSRCLACVDTGPLMDRAAAVRAGIGWFGKSGNVLTKEFGSYVFLAELITTLELEPDEPLQTNCGQCVECIVDCPTGAIGPNGEIDARRCISDLTQAKGPIPREYRKIIGNRLWGCDTCQTVCPVNDRKAAHTASRVRSAISHRHCNGFAFSSAYEQSGISALVWLHGHGLARQGSPAAQCRRGFGQLARPSRGASARCVPA